MEIRVPGDKSISHRALLLAALAEGESRLTGLLAGEDTNATAEILRSLGVDIPPLPTGEATGAEIRIRGVGLRGLRAASAPSELDAHSGIALDCGNSGTTARLLMGILAGSSIDATLDGDASLRSRPMRRITLPLSKMGARFEELGEPDRLPIRIRGGALQAIEYDSPVASAQIKSALILAGITGGVFVLLTEPGRSRDHTERMLRLAGVSILSFPAPHELGDSGAVPAAGEAWLIELREPPQKLSPLDFRVPGDFSSAAFPIALALLGGVGGDSRARDTTSDPLVLRDIGTNPTRTGLLAVLERMGAEIQIQPAASGGASDGASGGASAGVSGGMTGGASGGEQGPHGSHDVGEPTGDFIVRASALQGVEVGAGEIPGLIDEIPILAVLAARAQGTTRITGAAELRVKESDRLSALAGNLASLGVAVKELPDGLEIRGSDRPLEGRVPSFHDHRIAMAFGVLGALPGNRIEIEGREVVDVSYPGFWEMLRKVSAGS